MDQGLKRIFIGVALLIAFSSFITNNNLGAQAGGSGTTTLQSVLITSPTSGTTVDESILITVKADGAQSVDLNFVDPGGVSSSNAMSLNSSTGDWEYQWGVDTLSDGVYTIIALASSGNTNLETPGLNITVNNIQEFILTSSVSTLAAGDTLLLPSFPSVSLTSCESDREDRATVVVSGSSCLVTGISSGHVNISASSQEWETEISINITGSAPSNTFNLTPQGLHVDVGETGNLTTHPSTTLSTCQSSDSSIATVQVANDTCEVTGVAAGTVSIIASSTESAAETGITVVAVQTDSAENEETSSTGFIRRSKQNNQQAQTTEDSTATTSVNTDGTVEASTTSTTSLDTSTGVSNPAQPGTTTAGESNSTTTLNVDGTTSTVTELLPSEQKGKSDEKLTGQDRAEEQRANKEPEHEPVTPPIIEFLTNSIFQEDDSDVLFSTSTEVIRTKPRSRIEQFLNVVGITPDEPQKTVVKVTVELKKEVEPEEDIGPRAVRRVKRANLENRISEVATLEPISPDELSDELREEIAVSREEDEHIVLYPSDPSDTTSSAVVLLDTDRDGIADDTELRLGTNPRSSDSDNDGIPDADETFVVALSPIDTALLAGTPLEQPIDPDAGEIDEGYAVTEIIHSDEATTIRGIAEPNSVVTLFIYSYVPLVLTVETDENGAFEYTLEDELQGTQHLAYLALHAGGGRIAKKSVEYSFTVTEEEIDPTEDALDEPVFLAQNTQDEDQIDRTDARTEQVTDRRPMLFIFGGTALIVLIILLGVLIKKWSDEETE